MLTVNNYGCSRNKSCGHISTTMKWGKSVGKKGNCGRFWNNFARDNVLCPQDSCAEARTWLNVCDLHTFALSFPFPCCSSHAASATFFFLHKGIHSFFLNFPLILLPQVKLLGDVTEILIPKVAPTIQKLFLLGDAELWKRFHEEIPPSVAFAWVYLT